MTPEHRFNEHYKRGSPPWDICRPDFNLIQTVTTTPIPPCKALEIGCGTGDNAIWLSQQGFHVVGVDAAEIAIEKATEKAAETNSNCTFAALNFLKSHVEGGPFRFAFDRGCFHTMDSSEQRQGFTKQVHDHLEENGLWLSLIGNADDEHAGEGPPTLTAGDIANAVEPYVEILALISSHFETNLPFSPKAWACLMRKRRGV